MKKLIILLVVLTVLICGCLNSGEDKEQEDDTSEDSDGYSGSSGGSQRYEKMQAPEEIVTSEEMETEGETETFEETGTPEEIAEEMSTPENAGEIEEEQNENINAEDGENETVQPAETEAETYLVRLKNYVFIPSELEAKTGDLVVWRNFEDGLVTLTSEDGLFEDQNLEYGKTYKYVFTEAGSYNFNVNGYPNMHMTITVK